MTQQFKFGDRVRLKDEPLTPWENAGIIFAVYGDEKRGYYAAVCFQESGDFQDVPLDEIERVPHPDTSRLDFIEKVINIDGMVKRKMGEGWTLVAEHELSEPKPLLRDAIDTAMRIQAE